VHKLQVTYVIHSHINNSLHSHKLI
jgi:hypothetical protein